MQLKIKAFSLSIVMVAVSLSPAWADRVLRVSSGAALDGNVPIKVHVEGGGVLLDFAPTGERITKISLDDPSRIVVDHCLVTKCCSDRPSPIIRLFRSTGINFQDIPTAKVTMLSVETIDSQGNYHSYPFPVTIGMGRSLISKILVGDEESDNLFNNSTLTRNTAAPTTVALGVAEAESKSFLIDPQLKGRIRNYLALIESGMSSKKAAEKAGISADLVARLVQLGQAKVWEAKAKQPRVALRPNSPAVNPNPRVTVRSKNTTQNVRKSSPAQAKQTARSVPNPIAPATVRPKNKTQNVLESRTAIAKQPSRSVPLPKSSVVARRLPTYKPSKNHLQANALVKGLIIAKRQKSISNAIAAKVQDVIDNLRAGKDIATAAKRSGVRIDKINELLTLAGR
ncbi:MAG: hypothetical protein KME05_05165 [Gloeocapsa sp. UFS-A4-WI-NPMV-4B04]|jgi:hypothetical protein|nr:hypothetical protein [Gloeocapsa sp. UFS-A4-WI-NPMV-4B04]